MPIKPTERTDRIGEGLARRLRQSRERAGLKQEQVAERAGCTRAQIINLEAGKGGGARLDTVEALAEALGVPAGWLAFGG
jgi:transcriptional regulator with XRE-family HTH domain